MFRKIIGAVIWSPILLVAIASAWGFFVNADQGWMLLNGARDAFTGGLQMAQSAGSEAIKQTQGGNFIQREQR